MKIGLQNIFLLIISMGLLIIVFIIVFLNIFGEHASIKSNAVNKPVLYASPTPKYIEGVNVFVN